MTARLRRLSQSTATHLSFAFLAMGGWAMFANSGHPMPRPLIAGVVQGGISACLTFFLKSAVEILAKRFRRFAALWAPPLIACLVSTAILVTLHYLSGTPEILHTITVPLVVSTSYAAIYNYSLFRAGTAHAQRRTVKDGE